MIENNACYVIFLDSTYDGQTSGYVVLEHWCSGRERWSLTQDIMEASRFTAEAAWVRARCGELDAADTGRGELDALDLDPLYCKLTPVHVPLLDRNQLQLPLQG